MHWEILIIPLIALGVWILGTLFKTGEEVQMKKGVRRPGGASGRRPGRRPITDLDRFLEEARRRRQMEERPKPPPPRRTPPRSPQRPRPVRPREMPEIRSVEVPVALPVARPAAPPTAAEAVLVVEPDLAELPPVPPTAQRTPPSPLLRQVRSLMSHPQAAGVGFVLREIFDQPLCKRRR